MRPRNEQMRFVFTCEAEAKTVYNHALSIANEYGRVTLADINELIGNHPCYNDTKIYWTPVLLATAVKVAPGALCGWYIHCLDYLVDDSITHREEPCDETKDNYEDCEPHAVHINIATIDMDDPYCILGSVFKYVQEFHDRDVFINVY